MYSHTKNGKDSSSFVPVLFVVAVFVAFILFRLSLGQNDVSIPVGWQLFITPLFVPWVGGILLNFGFVRLEISCQGRMSGAFFCARQTSYSISWFPSKGAVGCKASRMTVAYSIKEELGGCKC